mgnify:CR=1 FL=1
MRISGSISANEVLNNRKKKVEFFKIKKAALFAKNNSLEVHAGHGLSYDSAHQFSKIDSISEYNIGHFIVAESIFIGIHNSIKKFKKVINK